MSPLKTPAQALEVLERRVSGAWAAAAAGHETSWNERVPLGEVASGTIGQDFDTHATWARTWFTWAQTHHAQLEVRARRVHGTEQQLPAALVVADLDTAVRLLGRNWPRMIAVARTRATQLQAEFPHLDGEQRTTIVREVTSWSDLDFDLLCRAGGWFAAHDATGLTPRQVPIGGMHGKWLNSRQHLVAALADRPDLGLAAPHPSRAHFTYLDPVHMGAGGRRHDVYTVDDTAAPCYQPRVVLICENKDTVVTFPPVAGGVAIEGNGRGPGTIAAIPWLAAAEHVVYWGDMDADGLEILDQLRTCGVPATSIFMDTTAYRTWSAYGTNHDPRGRELTGRTPRSTPTLHPSERELYEQLCDPAFTGHRRVEQERIPLRVAHAELQRLNAWRGCAEPG